MSLQDVPGAERFPTTAGTTVSQHFENISATLADQAADWLDHIEAVIERYPWPTVLVGLGIGYVIARRMR
jgi:predicted alpha/beta hydrolase family esterase